MRKLTKKEVKDVTDELRGSAGSLELTLSYRGIDIEQVDPESLDAIYDLIFRCEACEWYCDQDEQSEDPEMCLDCNPDLTEI